MTPTQAKKESLLNFIAWKMNHGGETDAEQKRTLTLLKKLSYKSLKQWAIENDFIDE